ncbi:unnamed protein product [Heligmosomoides polygyrus]|uniref:Uncharacterized protein n=1 Tax=Heligmosomoides polygyrus TaxID=6339 RepID=A0A3P8DEG9_HELPZ|nr:unnamed protein product [Heligmosomoides polygyrus]
MQKCFGVRGMRPFGAAAFDSGTHGSWPGPVVWAKNSGQPARLPEGTGRDLRRPRIALHVLPVYRVQAFRRAETVTIRTVTDTSTHTVHEHAAPTHKERVDPTQQEQGVHPLHPNCVSEQYTSHLEDHPSTKEGRSREGNVKTITPNYKLGSEKPSHELKLGTSGYLPNEKGDYKVRSNANMPLHSQTLPDAKKQLADDFPSQHSKRSLIKLEPLEQRRFKSTESRPITTSNYLTESVERHRDMEASRLRDYLKAKESDANKPWNKPGWPGPKVISKEALSEKGSRQSRTSAKRAVLKNGSTYQPSGCISQCFRCFFLFLDSSPRTTPQSTCSLDQELILSYHFLLPFSSRLTSTYFFSSLMLIM